MFYDFICGRCAREQGMSLDERKALVETLEIGNNECDCGRVIVWTGHRLTVLSNKIEKSVLEE